MKSLKRLHLEELEDRFHVLSQEEQDALFGAGKTYTFDQNGHLVGTPSDNGNGNPDMIAIGDKTCNCPTDICFSTFTGNWETDELDGNGNKIIEPYCGVSITGANPEMFEFMAENTNVEWGLSYNECEVNRRDKPYGVMVTNHDGSGVKPDNNLLQAGYDTLYHSHPNGNPASDSDVSTYYSLRNRINQEQYIYRNMLIYNPLEGCYTVVE